MVENKLHITKRGFTLAEVLITIAIIGIVAAITLPFINKQCQKIILQNQIKKAYAEVRLGIKLSEADNGPMASWPTGADMVMKDYWQTYLKPYFQGAVLCQTINTCGYDKNKEKYNDSVFTTKWLGGYWKVFSDDTRILFQLKDNTTIFIIKNTVSNGVPICLDDYFWIDVNGPKKPNTLNKDVFKVRRNTNTGITPMETLLQIQKNGWKLPQNFSL